MEETLFIPSPRSLPLEAIKRGMEDFVGKVEPKDARQAAWALEELLQRSPNPVNLRQELLLRSGKALALVLVEPPGEEGFLLGTFLRAPYAQPSPLGLLLAREEGRAYLEELTKRTREAVPGLPEGLFPRWFQVGLLRFVEDPFGHVRLVHAPPLGLLRLAPPLSWREMKAEPDGELARALSARTGRAVPPGVFLDLLEGRRPPERKVEEARKALVLASLGEV